MMISCNYALPDGFAKMEEGRAKDSVQYLCKHGFTYGTKLHITDSLLMSWEYDNKNIGYVQRRAYWEPKISQNLIKNFFTAIFFTAKNQWQYAVMKGDSVARDEKGQEIWKSVSGKTDSIEQKTKVFFALKGDQILIDDIKNQKGLTWVGVKYQRNGVETYAWTYLGQLIKRNAKIAPDRWTRFLPNWKPKIYIIISLIYIIAVTVFFICFADKLLPEEPSKIGKVLKKFLYGFICSFCFFWFILMWNSATRTHYYLVPDIFDWSGQPLLINLMNISILGSVILFGLVALISVVTMKPGDALKSLAWRFAVVLFVISLAVLASFAIWLMIIFFILSSVFGTAAAQMNKGGMQTCPRCGYRYANIGSCPACPVDGAVLEKYKQK